MPNEEYKYTNAYIDQVKADLAYTDASLATLITRNLDYAGVADASGRINDFVIQDNSTFLKTAAGTWRYWECLDISISTTS